MSDRKPNKKSKQPRPGNRPLKELGIYYCRICRDPVHWEEGDEHLGGYAHPSCIRPLLAILQAARDEADRIANS